MSPKPKPSEAEIWERIIRPQGPMSKETARQIARIEFGADDVERMHELAERNRHGAISDDEAEELDHYCRVGSLLAALKLRSQEVLRRRGGSK